MDIIPTKNLKGILYAYTHGYRRCLLEGGTSSSKTWGALQALFLIAERATSPLLISVVSETLPHIKRGALRDFFSILDESQDNNPNFSKSELVDKRPEWKARIEFFGADDDSKVRGPRRDILFMNEGNNIPWETARGLDVRTNLFTIVDWNPVGEFWAHQYESGGQLIPGWIHEPDTYYIHSTYRDALHVLRKTIVENIITTAQRDPNWGNIYAEGRLGKIEGLVYPFFEQVDALPSGDYFYGLDFGFSTDVTALSKNVIIGDNLYSQELIYEVGLTNQDIASRMVDLGIQKRSDEIFADSAEPKSIEELYRTGYNVKGAPKGPGSVEYGRQKVNQYKQHWTKDSTNAIKEQRNHRYIADKNGKLTDKTTHQWSHLCDDSRRYAIIGKIKYTTTESMGKPAPTPGKRTVLSEMY